MRVYIVSNREEGNDEFSNAIESLGANITLKETTSDEKKLSDGVALAINSSKPDFVLVLANDPIAVNVSLNKQRNVTAAICNTQRDIDLAFKNEVNVIIVGEDVHDPQRFAHMLFSKHQSHPAKPQAPEKPKPIKVQEVKQVQKEEKKEQPRHEDLPEDINLPKRPGLLGKLKDSLGIIDK